LDGRIEEMKIQYIGWYCETCWYVNAYDYTGDDTQWPQNCVTCKEAVDEGEEKRRKEEGKKYVPPPLAPSGKPWYESNKDEVRHALWVKPDIE
jgi:hypothetical protein